MTRARHGLIVSFALGCSSRIEMSASTGDDTTSTGTPGTSVTTTSSSSSTDPSTSATTDPDTGETGMSSTNGGGYEDDTGGTGCVFTCPPPASTGGGGGGGSIIECDLAAQDCPEGEKCMPWANDGGAVWNGTRCSPLDPNAIADGDVCTVEGSGISGIDNCEVGSMCTEVDPKTNLGVCHALCVSGADPCDDGQSCVTFVPNIVELCVEGCDPLAPSCGPGVCAPASEGFACGVGGTQALGDPCSEPTDCAIGSLCVAGNLLPTCDEVGCCAALCDVAEDGCDDPLICTPWDAAATPPWDHVGVCIAEL